MINRTILDVLTNIFGIFILITLYLILHFSRVETLSVQGVLLPLEEKSDKDFFYVEATRNYAIPLGHGGKCDEDLYKIIRLNSDAYSCIIPKSKIEEHRTELNFYNSSSRLNKILNKSSTDDLYFVILARPSSFAIYHDLAKTIKQAGFEVGWSPIDEEQPLSFSPYGKRVGVQ